MLETLHCTVHNGPFTRERKRGVKPSVCPDCKGKQETTRLADLRENVGGAIQAAIRALDPDLVTMYREVSGQPERVVTAFLIADREPPFRDRTDRIGFTFAEDKLLAAIRVALPDTDNEPVTL